MNYNIKLPHDQKQLLEPIYNSFTAQISKLRSTYDALRVKQIPYVSRPLPKTRAGTKSKLSAVARQIQKLKEQGEGEYSGSKRYHQLTDHLVQLEEADIGFGVRQEH